MYCKEMHIADPHTAKRQKRKQISKKECNTFFQQAYEKQKSEMNRHSSDFAVAVAVVIAISIAISRAPCSDQCSVGLFSLYWFQSMKRSSLKYDRDPGTGIQCKPLTFQNFQIKSSITAAQQQHVHAIASLIHSAYMQFYALLKIVLKL